MPRVASVAPLEISSILARLGDGTVRETGWTRRRFLAAAGALACCFASRLSAGAPAEADTSDAARAEALRSIPFDSLTPKSQARLRAAVSDPSLYRRMPVEVVPCDPDLFIFLVRNPDVIVGLWRLMNVTQLKVGRVEPYVFDAVDGMGTVARAELLYGDPHMHVVLGEGYYEGSLLRRKTHGTSALVLKTGYFRGDDGSPYVSVQLDFFLTVEAGGADFLTRTLQPMVGRSIDMNFAESAKFLGRVHQVSEMNGPGMADLAPKLDNCAPETQREFAAVVRGAHDRFLARHGAGDVLAASATPPSVGGPPLLAPGRAN